MSTVTGLKRQAIRKHNTYIREKGVASAQMALIGPAKRLSGVVSKRLSSSLYARNESVAHKAGRKIQIEAKTVGSIRRAKEAAEKKMNQAKAEIQRLHSEIRALAESEKVDVPAEITNFERSHPDAMA